MLVKPDLRALPAQQVLRELLAPPAPREIKGIKVMPGQRVQPDPLAQKETLAMQEEQASKVPQDQPAHKVIQAPPAPRGLPDLRVRQAQQVLQVPKEIKETRGLQVM